MSIRKHIQASEVTIHGSEDSNLSGNITIKDTDGLTKLTIEEVEPDITDLTLTPVVGTNDSPNTASIAWEYKPDATSSNNTEGNLALQLR